MTVSYHYVRNPDAIYRESFAQVEQALAPYAALIEGMPPVIRSVARRLVHTTGDPSVVETLTYGGELGIGRAMELLHRDCLLFCDVRMVVAGLQGVIVPQERLICTLPSGGGFSHLRAGEETRITRSARGVAAWPTASVPRTSVSTALASLAGLQDAIVVIGNAPTALYALLEGLEAGWSPPALVIGMPVGFVGSAESKQALIEMGQKTQLPYITLQGTRGGAALAVATTIALWRAGRDGQAGQGEPAGQAEQATHEKR
ncbi:MAG: precorrin-8X methylmutase [Alphaproteobacteria bacterium]|nr:precorrin-8X methylmutase [Alphaproteobacteria bacterium]